MREGTVMGLETVHGIGLSTAFIVDGIDRRRLLFMLFLLMLNLWELA